MTSRANKKKIKKKRAGPAQIVHPWFIILDINKDFGLPAAQTAQASHVSCFLYHTHETRSATFVTTLLN